MATSYTDQAVSWLQNNPAWAGVSDQIQRAQRRQVEQIAPAVLQQQANEDAGTESVTQPYSAPIEPFVPEPLPPAPSFAQTAGAVARTGWPALAAAGVLFFGAGMAVGYYWKE